MVSVGDPLEDQKNRSLWDRAKKIVPGGNQCVSRRPDRYCPGRYPSHFNSSLGCKVATSDGRVYDDFHLMGIGANILGYRYPYVDACVKEVIGMGANTTLNCPEEVELAETLLKDNQKMDMVRFGLTGADACAQAIRICNENCNEVPFGWYIHLGYSGWILGTPERTFGDPCSIDSLEDLEKCGWDAPPSCIIIEPVRNKVDMDLLQYVRGFCNDNNIPLVFDEVTTGYRMNPSGIYHKLGITPDIVVYGKALGNGYPISAVVGKREIMECAEDTFISSTFYSHRIGYTAALATLEQIKKYNVCNHLIRVGGIVRDQMGCIAEENGFKINQTGINPLYTWEFDRAKDGLKDHLMTLYTQEMLKRGYLAGSQLYASFAHKENMVWDFLDNVAEVFEDIAEGRVKLEGRIKEPGWKRMN